MSDSRSGAERWLGGALALVSVVALATLAALCADHLRFPLHLDLMEGAILQHFQRAAAGAVVYPEASPEFTPLAYNVLLYYAAVPLSWLAGVELPTLRAVSVLALAGVVVVLFVAAREKSGSTRVGLICAGLFAGAYRAMDAYLDSAHSDASMLFAALLGTLVVDRARTTRGRLAGVALLVLSFWFKQHGALFTIGGVLFLTGRVGVRRSWPYWALAAGLGPIAYLLLGPRLFGSHFLYFTWEVPRAWSVVNAATAKRLVEFFGTHYPLLATASLALLFRRFLLRRGSVDAWTVQLVFAGASAVMGALDDGSSDNVFIGLGTFLVLNGTLAIHAAGCASRAPSAPAWALVLLLVSFGVRRYDPRTLWTGRRADAVYAEFTAFLRGLDGPVYAPTLGYVGEDAPLAPTVQWVALEDMIRGPGRDTRDHPLTHRLLAPAFEPRGTAYVLTHHPLDRDFAWIGLHPYYELVEDLGDRFRAIGVLPKRWHHGWPRYLYRSRSD